MNRQLGLTLLEILIGMFLGLIVIGTTLVIYVSSVTGSRDIVRSARLNHDLDSAMSLMINDIRRAGYWRNAVIESDSRDNPFTAPGANMAIMNFSATDDCILYSYDADGDGSFDNDGDGVVDDTNEFYGFRRNNNTIEMRLAGVNTTDCSDTDASWEPLTINVGDERLNITQLQFSFEPIAGLPASSRCINETQEPDAISNALNCGPPQPAPVSGDQLVQRRIVNIVMTGAANSDASVGKTLTATTQVRNDRLLIQP